MPYVVTEKCIRCRYLDCIDVCPVDCFYVGANMVVIHPDECIDCGVCEPECPVDAIVSDVEPEAGAWLEHNRKYAQQWPNLPAPVDPSGVYPDADSFKDLPDKFARFFDPAPGDL